MSNSAAVSARESVALVIESPCLDWREYTGSRGARAADKRADLRLHKELN